jgi:multicomponent Na+:H+ antiporter subunit D
MNLLALPLILPIAFALLGAALRGHARLRQVVGVLSAAALPLSVVPLCLAVAGGEVHSLALGNWAAPFGIVLVADMTAAIFLATAGCTAGLVFLHAAVNRLCSPLDRWFFPLANFLMFGVNGSLLTGDLFNLFVMFEVMLIASFVLMVIGGKRPQLEGGLKYVVINLVGSALFLTGIGMLYGKTGSLNIADIAMKIQLLEDPSMARSSVILLFGAFAIKAGLFPFFFWLPASYHTPPAVVTALFAGLLTKVGVYTMFRVLSLFVGADFGAWQGLLMWTAALTMITGVLGAAAHFHMRRILAFHIISQIGYLLAGFAMFTVAGIAAALFYFIHNNLAKTSLLLINDNVERRFGNARLENTGGLYKAAPWLAVAFLICALALAGIPPLSGFWAKLAIVRAGIGDGFGWLVAAALGVGMWTLFSMTKLWAEVFWKARPQGNETAHGTPPGAAACVPLAGFVVLIIALSLGGGPVVEFCTRAATQLLDPSVYIDAVLGKEVAP